MLLSAVNVEKKVRNERRKWPIAIAFNLSEDFWTT